MNPTPSRNGGVDHSAPSSPGVDVAVVLPAYNEIVSLPILIPRLVHALSRLDESYRIIVVDDGSTDGTDEVARRAERDGVPLTLVRHSKNRGLGRALRTGLLTGIQTARVVVTMDADNTHDPALIQSLLARLEADNDVAIASRFETGGAEVGVPQHRRALSRVASWLMKSLAGFEGVRDYSSGFRAYRSELLHQMVRHYGEDGIVRERSFACMLEVLLKAGARGARIAEVPLVLRYDAKETPSKMRFFRTVRGYGAVVRKHRRELRNPDAPPKGPVDTRWWPRHLLSAAADVGILAAAPVMAVGAAVARTQPSTSERPTAVVPKREKSSATVGT